MSSYIFSLQVNIKSARMLRPGNSLRRQIYCVSGSADDVERFAAIEDRSSNKATSSSSSSRGEFQRFLRLMGQSNGFPTTSSSSSSSDNSGVVMDYGQVFQSPWCCTAAKEDQFRSLMEDLFHLELDDSAAVLLVLLSVLSTDTCVDLVDRAAVVGLQRRFGRLLYEYLCGAVGVERAARVFPKYLRILSQLREMANIMDKEMLKF